MVWQVLSEGKVSMDRLFGEPFSYNTPMNAVCVGMAALSSQVKEIEKALRIVPA